MNKLWQKLNFDLIKGKKLYLFLIIVLIIGVIFGSFFITILKADDKVAVSNQILSFFEQIKNNHMDYFQAFKNSILTNFVFIILIWLVGISIIGIPVIIFLIFMKGFVIGFSIGAIIMQFKLWGILGSLTYIFPHIIISTIVMIIISCYALYLSFNFFWALLQKRSINFKDIVNKYAWILLVCSVLTIIASLIEVFISPYFIKFFLMFVKL
jgi:stage II sporulation protein M